MPTPITLLRICTIAAIINLASCTSKELFVKSFKKQWKENSEYYSEKEKLRDTVISLPGTKISALISKETLLNPLPFRSLVYSSNNENFAITIYSLNGNLELEIELKEIKKKLFYKDLEINLLKSKTQKTTQGKQQYKIITKKVEVLPWYFKPLIYAAGIIFCINIIQVIYFAIKLYFRKRSFNFRKLNNT